MSEVRAAPPPKQQVGVGSDADFVAGKFVMVDIPGHDIGVIRLAGGELRAVRNWCPHKGAKICGGIVGGTWPPTTPGELQFAHAGEVLVCPWHGFEYDLNTGKEMFGTGMTRLRMYPVTVADGQVFVTV